jgi:gliding motility-associated-like protein
LCTPTFVAVAPICPGGILSPLPTTSTNGINGIWSPALNNMATTTYTFTPDPGQCASTTTMTITVAPFTGITPSPLELCDDNNDGFGIFNLSDATNEISGGSLPPDVSITYHLTQSDAQTGANALPTTGYPNNDPWTQTIYVRVFYTLTGCANYVQLQLIVHPKPVATTPSDYHVCDDNADGTAVFDLSTVIPQVLGTISAATHTVTFHTTEQNAIDDINPITGITNYSSASTTIWIRVETNATGCYDVVPLNLVVDSLPIANVPYIYRKCDYNSPLGYEIFDLTSQVPTILNGQTGMQVIFYPSLANAQSGTNAINGSTSSNNPSAYQNAVIYVQTVGIRIINSATGCYVVSSLDLYVDQLPTPTPPAAPLTVCDSDQNGWDSFNLCSLDSEIQNGQTPAYILTYHVTLADAQNDINAIGCTYQNNFALSQTIYVRAEDAQTGCYSTLPIQLNVNASPIMPSLSNLQLCDTDSATQDGCTTFNLSSQTPTVLAANTPSSNYTVTYYTTQANAEAIPNGNLPIVGTSSYFACNGTTIWVRVQHNTTGCFEVGSFQLIVNTPIVLAAPTLYKECDNDSAPNDLHTSFDILNFVSSSVPSGYTIAFYSNAAHTLPISSPYTNTVNANQTIYWTATNNTTGCVSSATLTLVVIPVPTPKYDPAPLASCDTVGPPNDGCEVFNLTTNATYIMNNEPNVELHYYPSQIDADALTNEIMTPAAANVCGDVYIRVQWVSTFGFTDYTNQPCYVVVRQPIFIDPLPLMQAGQTYQECDDDTDGFTPFNLVQYVTNTAATPPFLIVNPNINIASVTFTYYTDVAMTQAIATPSAFTNTSNPQTVYIMASHTTSHTVNGVTISTTCTATQSLSLVVNPKPTLTVPAAGILDTCDTDGIANDGYFIRDLTLLNSGILGVAQPPADYTVSYYESEYNPDAVTPLTPAPITTPTAYATHTQTLWVSVTNNVTGCYRAAPIAIVVEQLPDPEITYNFDVLCVDFNNDQVLREVVLTAHNDVVYLGAPTIAPPTYTYQWYNSAGAITGATQSTYTINQALTNNTADTYHVVMTSISTLGCSTASANQPIIQSGPATPSDAAQVGYTVTNAFAENQIITVTVDGYGVYEYSLDDGPRQTSTVFENVGIGNHTIYVWDTEGGLSSSCDPLVITNVQTIDYPHYFTPNGDGYHDTWNIQGLYNQPNAKIYIFDRYGKLIKQLSSQSLGWDGTYNGNILPASDYWFTVDFIENNAQKQFKAHFSLKR